MQLLFILIAVCTVALTQTCKIKTDKGSYNLSPISGKSYHVVDPVSKFVSYDFSFCSNVANISGCPNSVGSVSALQHTSVYGQCYSLGQWDSSYLSEDDGLVSTTNGFQIKFKNGDSSLCPEKRTLIYDFQCEGGVSVGTLSLSVPANCEYEVTVPTKYVCSSVAGGLSGGTIFLIVLLSVIILYCIIGIGYNQRKGGTRGFKESVPQSELWCEKCPFWTKTGCLVSWTFTCSTLRLCMRKLCKKGSRGNDDVDDNGPYEEVE